MFLLKVHYYTFKMLNQSKLSMLLKLFVQQPAIKKSLDYCTLVIINAPTLKGS